MNFEFVSLFKRKFETEEEFRFFLFSFFLLLIPFLTHFQPLTGSLVNFLLILASFTVGKRWKYLLAIFPSLSAVAKGLLFGPLTPFLIPLLPFIWISNSILIYFCEREGFWKGVIKGIIGKVLFLAFFSYLLISLSVFPSKLFFAFSIMQFFTAFAGAILAWLLLKRLTIY